MTPKEYFKAYRKSLGFSSQADAKAYLGAKDLVADIDYDYIDNLFARLKDILCRVNGVIWEGVRRESLEDFLKVSLDNPYEQIRGNGIIPHLNNQGRRPEDVLFSWMRGYVFQEYFSGLACSLMGGDPVSCTRIGGDDFSSVETFKRTPVADLSVMVSGVAVHLEMQSGFAGQNDIKQHKYREAMRLYQENGTPTVCVHFDIYNGQAAFVRLDQIEENDQNWVVRTQMEGQYVLAIDQNYFYWRMLDAPPDPKELGLELNL